MLSVEVSFAAERGAVAGDERVDFNVFTVLLLRATFAACEIEPRWQF